MSKILLTDTDPLQWNALLSPWIEALDSNGVSTKISPCDALQEAPNLDRLAFSNPLDLFSAYRFLLTLIYWKAEDFGGICSIRNLFLSEKVPEKLLDSLITESALFGLFDFRQPFMQDPSCFDAKKSPPSYFFAEMASGTNLAHFHHGHDSTSQLCLPCATRGLVRLVSWTQSGGSGLQPSIHGAPPIMALAQGKSLAVTLGLNLIPLEGPAGAPQWSGQFQPAKKEKVVPYLEALTWNPRRVNLLQPKENCGCSLCGREGVAAVGPIIFEKNDACMDKTEEGMAYKDFWKDPAAFYRAKDGKTVKATDESETVDSSDLSRLFPRKGKSNEETAPKCAVLDANPDHDNWLLIIPCTNPANNKTFDHRLVNYPRKLTGALTNQNTPVPEAFWRAGDLRALFRPGKVVAGPGAKKFVKAAQRLADSDWAAIARCSGKPMSHDVEAFDIFSSIYWGIRGKEPSAPSRDAAWMTLKLMSTCESRKTSTQQLLQPWTQLETSQPRQKSRGGPALAYPRSIPRGNLLENELAKIISRFPGKAVDWESLCQFLHNHLSQ